MEASKHRKGRLIIGDLVLDPGKRQIRRGDDVLSLPKLSYRLVEALARAAPDVLTQEDLAKIVWPGRIISPETVTQRIKLVRKALSDDANAPRYIGLVRGAGYRMLAAVDELPPDNSSVTRGLLAELSRRNVLQVALVYAAIAWSITEVVSFLLDALPVFPEWSKPLVAILFVVGFPVAMFLAWRFDIDRNGIRRTVAASKEGRMTIAVATTLLVGATAGLFYLIYPSVLERSLVAGSGNVGHLRIEPAANSIAILPFANTSADPEDLYISEGLGDQLRDQLGQVSALQVAARSSSVIFREESIDAVNIAQRLAVEKLVEGTMRRQGDALNITVQIINGSTGFSEWTATYEPLESELLDEQLRIAEDILRQLAPEVDPKTTATSLTTLNATANDLFMLANLRFREVQEAPSIDPGQLAKVIDLYERVTIADPESALSFSRLGEAHLTAGDVINAEKALTRAIGIDSNLSEVQNTLGLYYWNRFLEGSGDAHLKAIELNPNNADAHEKYAKWLWHQQETDDTEPYFLRALELDAMSLKRYLDLGHFYGISNRRAEALAVVEQIKLKFTDASAYMAIARIYELTGDLDEGIAWALKARRLQPDSPLTSWMVAELYARIGDFDSAREFEDADSALNILYWERRYDEMIELGEDLVFEPLVQIQTWFGLARAYAANGAYDQAIFALRSHGLPDNAKVDARRANGLEAFVTLADALNETGKTVLAKEYASWLAQRFSKLSDTGAGDSWWPNLYESCSLSILGKDEEALSTLERVNNSIGLLWYPMLKDAPCFRKYQSNARYQSVVTNYEIRLFELRKRLPNTLARHQFMQQRID